MTTYIITIALDVSRETDEHLQTPQGIEDEVRSWLTDLGADVKIVTVEVRSSSSVRAVLSRPLYRGIIVYCKTAKAYGRELGKRNGKEKGMIPKPEDRWLRLEVLRCASSIPMSPRASMRGVKIDALATSLPSRKAVACRNARTENICSPAGC